MSPDDELWEIIRDSLPDLPSPFTVQNLATYLTSKGYSYDRRRIRRYLRYMSANTPHKKSSVPSNILFKIDQSTYRPFDPDHEDPYEFSGVEDEGSTHDEPTEEDLEFALELHLEDFIEANWSRIDFGCSLSLDADGKAGRQFRTDVGPIDFLCRDSTSGDFVVIELKKGRTSDKVVGQCLRYMGWVKEHLANDGQRVRGLIIAPEEDERLRYALTMVPGVEMLCYRVDFQLIDPAEADRD